MLFIKRANAFSAGGVNNSLSPHRHTKPKERVGHTELEQLPVSDDQRISVNNLTVR